MFGLILAWAFADTTQTVEAKMPTLPTAIRARFIVYLPLDAIGSGKYREKANVPSVALSNENPARVCGIAKRGRSGGVSRQRWVRVPLGKHMGQTNIPHGTSGTNSP